MQDQLETIKEIISSFLMDSKDGKKKLLEWFLNCQCQTNFPQKRQNKNPQKRQLKFPHFITEMGELACLGMRGGI